MNHIGNGAQTVQGIEAIHPLGGVGHTDGHPVAPPNPHGGKGPGGQVHPLHEGGVVGLFAHELVGDVPGVFPGGPGYHLVHGFMGIVDMGRGVTIEFHPGGAGGK